MNVDFEKKAMNGEPLPKCLDIADSCLYIAFEYLYKAYRAGIMTKDEAKREKESLLYNYATDKGKLDFLSRDCLSLSARISNASEEYVRNPSIETANKLYAAFYNLPDDWATLDKGEKM